jgi:hypothetical protein
MTCHPKMYLHTEFGIQQSNNTGDMLMTSFFLKLRSKVKVKDKDKVTEA